jgi:hypothetical protein
MESISIQDAVYLVALTASEESMLIEFEWEFDKWGCDKDSVLKIIRQLIEDNIIAFTKPVGNGFEDLSVNEALVLAGSWGGLHRKDIIVYLTPNGEKRWEVDDWGISTSRARHLLFSSSGKISRIGG